MLPRMSRLPLRHRTPACWADQVLADPLALLNDHAHLERKAAVNAMAMITHWPDARLPDDWATSLTAVARDEADHLARVTRILLRRGGQLSNSHKNPYAGALRKLVRSGQGWQEIVDRLLISALIEARSCERFRVLADHGEDAELTGLFGALWASEQGHYKMFLQMAEQLESRTAVKTRWDQLLDDEARIIQAQTPGPRIHSGVKTE